MTCANRPSSSKKRESLHIVMWRLSLYVKRAIDYLCKQMLSALGGNALVMSERLLPQRILAEQGSTGAVRCFQLDCGMGNIE